jgi:hypothetical protein
MQVGEWDLGSDIEATPQVTVVVPLRDEEATLEALYESVREVLEGGQIPFEIVFVDDGSEDESLAVLTMLARLDARVRPISLRTRFGKAAAYSTGFRESRGRAVVTMDADLQDDATDIPRMLARLSDGFGVVSGWRRQRSDTRLRRRASKIYNWATRRVAGVNLHDFNCGMKAYDGECAREIADEIYGERHRYIPVIAAAHGYRVDEIAVSNHARHKGGSRYGPERYLRTFADFLAVGFASRYGRKPMHMFAGVALASILVSMLAVGAAAVGWALGHPTLILPFLILAALGFAMGVQAVLVGLVVETSVAQGDPASVPYTAVVVVTDDTAIPDKRILRNALIVLPGEKDELAPEGAFEAER